MLEKKQNSAAASAAWSTVDCRPVISTPARVSPLTKFPLANSTLSEVLTFWSIDNSMSLMYRLSKTPVAQAFSTLPTLPSPLFLGTKFLVAIMYNTLYIIKLIYPQ